MTQEDKELLLKDLCARLPYGVKAYSENVDLNGTVSGLSPYSVFLLELHDWWDIEFVRPYLRPMSSMTEEEEDLLSGFNCYYINGELFFSCSHSQEDIYNAIDWLNAHQFDYRGLIEKGLALEAPKEMYK